MRKPKNSKVRKDIKAAINRLEQVIEDAKRRGDTDYFTKENEHGETQSDIDTLYLSILKNPKGLFGKKFHVERYESE
ncbi:MAG: hypothetical protein J6T98_08955 [Salinivirgaceae bacterium]|nr:hypothetical protein [Bacteroidales bacterium]MBO7496671.1 hypothetical protein [Salinivirgaceae bacterium]